MVGAKAAPHHGCCKKRKLFIRKQVLILYVLFVYLPMFVSHRSLPAEEGLDYMP
jgi:hypothetical protein